MTSSPLLSVCIITYNHEPYIEQALRSALMQETTFDYEIVIGEDCSTDRTRELLLRLDADYPGRLRLLLRDTNLGMMRNLTETYGASRGEYVALLEGDDYWTDPHKLQRQVVALQNHPTWSACAHPVCIVSQFGEDINRVHPQPAPAQVTLKDLFRQNLMQMCSVVLRRERIANIPRWFLDLKLADWPLFILLAETGPIGFLPEIMACYRLHPSGLWSQHHTLFHLQAVLTMFMELDRNTGGRHAAEIRASRDRMLAEFFSAMDDQLESLRRSVHDYRTSWSFRLGYALTSPLRLAMDLLRRRPSETSL